MSMIVKIGVVGAIGFAATTGASAQTIAEAMNPSDFLAISEAPLDMAELSEARGGFKFGGFDFKFGVQVSPVVITSIGDPFPDGVFGKNGVFGENGAPATGKDGIFGEDGVFGPGGVFGQNGPPPSNKAEALGGGNASVETALAPVQQALSTKIVYTPSALSSVPSTQVTQTVPDIQQNIADSGSSNSNASAPQTPTYRVSGADVAKMDTPTSPTYKVSAEEVAKVESYTSYQEIAAGMNTILSNTLNNVQIRRVININVVVSNFDVRVNRAIGDTVTATIASTYGLLSRF